jgi:signal transduction histidine kinase
VYPGRHLSAVMFLGPSATGLWACLIALPLTAQTPFPSSSGQAKHEVLILLADQPGRPFTDRILSGFRSVTMRERNPSVSVFAEYAGGYADESAEVAAERANWFEAKYKKHHLGVVVAVGAPSIELARSFRTGLFKDAFVVWAAGEFEPRPAPIERASGLILPVNSFGTFKLAQQLMPGATYVAVYGGGSKFDQPPRERFLEFLRAEAPDLRVLDFSGMPPDELKNKVAQLPPGGSIQYLATLADRNDRPTDTFEIMSALSQSRVPVFSYEDMSMGSGNLGGELLSWTDVGRTLGNMTLRADRGKGVNGSVETAPRTASIDWRQLNKFGIPEGRVPPGVQILYRPPSLWAEHRVAVTLSALALLIQTLLIGSLLAERARRRVVQAEARESEAVASAMLTSVPGYVVMLDRDGKVLRANDHIVAPESEFEKVLAGAVPDSNYFDVWNLGSDDSKRVITEVRRLTTGEINELTLVKFRPSPTGGAWLEIRGEHLDGGRGGAVVTHVDITDRKRAEMKAAADLDALSHLDRVAALGELSASLAHELNQPLAGMLSNAEAAEKLLALTPPDISEAREAVIDIAGESRRAFAIITKLRQMLKKEQASFEPVSLNEAVRDVTGFLAADAARRHVKIDLDLARDLPLVLADMVQLQQVVLNLMTNAMDAMETQSEETRNLRLVTCCDRRSKLVELQVRDQGPGIASDQLGRLFEPFHTTKRNGLGMGLSICRSIIDSVKGKIRAANSPEGGAVLSVTIPALAETAEPVSAERAAL